MHPENKLDHVHARKLYIAKADPTYAISASFPHSYLENGTILN